jgi:primase-polymerase (primpol)-like protein
VSTTASGAQRHWGALENIPEELRHRRQWVNWRYEERNGKLTKVPYKPGTRHRASCTDLEEWGSFEEAIAALDTGALDFDGLGFMLSSGDPYTFVDLDKCRDPETGEIGQEAQEIIDSLGGYAEVSPSGEGVHIFVRGKVPRGRKRGWIEVYSTERYATITGVTL